MKEINLSSEDINFLRELQINQKYKRDYVKIATITLLTLNFHLKNIS
ncbi:MAG: hypothetical protein KatS3mg068_0870 [Candidatus Sericytochromatia bacterium]|nr:MAG: hypothetical protein KatS3mg068_0870 [Candidatus Sericytochromatia bacterium]